MKGIQRPDEKGNDDYRHNYANNAARYFLHNDYAGEDDNDEGNDVFHNTVFST